MKAHGLVTVLSYPEGQFLSKFRQRLELSDILFNYYNPFFSIKFKQFIKKHNPDIIHCQFGHDALILYDNYFDKHKKIVVTFRGYDASLKLILKTYTKKLDEFLSKPNVFPVFVSASLRDNLTKSKIRFNAVNKILYSNIDTEFYTRKSYNHSRATIIFTQVSNFKEKKGHYHTIKAFEQFHMSYPDVDFKLIFIGSIDDDCSKLKKELVDSPILERIFFIGKLDSNGIRNQLEQSHFFVHNSITSKFNDQEGIPNAIMEAMSMELPILTTRHSGITELDNGNVNIFFSKEKDINDYVTNIKKAVSFGAYSINNRVRIQQSFSKDRFTTELLEFYTSLIQ